MQTLGPTELEPAFFARFFDDLYTYLSLGNTGLDIT